MGCLIPHRIHVFDLDSGYGYLRSRVTLSSHPFTVFDTSHQLQIAACRGVTIVSPNVAEENTLVPFVVVIRLAVSQLVLLCVNLEGPGGLCVGVHCHGWELMRLIIDFLESTPLIRLLLLLVVGCWLLLLLLETPSAGHRVPRIEVKSTVVVHPWPSAVHKVQIFAQIQCLPVNSHCFIAKQ